MWTCVFGIILFKFHEFCLIDIITLCMNPSFTLVAADEIVRAVFFVGHVADGAKVALFVAFITFWTKTLLSAHGVLAFAVPFGIAVACDRLQSFLAAQTLNAIITKPILLRHFEKWWLQAMNMHSYVAHFADYDFIFIVWKMTVLTHFAIWTFPLLRILNVLRWVLDLFDQTST